MKNHLAGLIIGLVAGGVDCALFAASGMAITVPVAASGLLSWMAVGWTIHMVEMPVPSIVKGTLISVFFMIPWIIEFVVNQKQADLLLPMLVVGTVFGGALGLVSRYVGERLRGRRNIRGDSAAAPG